MKITKTLYRQHPQQGYSLIELLIALVLGMTVLVGLSTVFVTVKQTFRFQETSGRMQEDGVFALDSIAQNLRMAGNAGCVGIRDRVTIPDPDNITVRKLPFFPESTLKSPNGINGVNPLATIYPDTKFDTQPFTPFNFILGFDGVEKKMFALGEEPVTGATNSLFFAGGSAKTVAIAISPLSTSSSLTLVGDPYNWSAAKNYDMIVSNCENSFIFKGEVTMSGSPSTVSIGYSAFEKTGEDLKARWSKTKTTIDNNGEKIETTTKTEIPIAFKKDAIVMPAEWSFYYVATRPGAETPSLYRVFFDGNKRGEPEEIVSNVESMRLHYGENTADDDPPVIKNWRTCASGPKTPICDPVGDDWSRIVAVRIGLMMVSAENNVNPGGVELESRKYSLLGGDYIIPLGSSKRLHKEFSTTVVLRNRTNW